MKVSQALLKTLSYQRRILFLRIRNCNLDRKHALDHIDQSDFRASAAGR
jgi:hypothetical protein